MKYFAILGIFLCTTVYAQNLNLTATSTEWRQGAYQRNEIKNKGVHVANSPQNAVSYNPINQTPGTSNGLNMRTVTAPVITATIGGGTHTASGKTVAFHNINPNLLTPSLVVGFNYATKLRAPSINPPDSAICKADCGAGVYAARAYKVNDHRENFINMVRAEIQFKALMTTNRRADTGPADLRKAMYFKMRHTDLKCWFDSTYVNGSGVNTGAWIIEGQRSNEFGTIVRHNRQHGTAIVVEGLDIDKTFKIQDSFPQKGTLKPELWVFAKNPFVHAVFPGLRSSCGSLNLTGVNHQTLDETAFGWTYLKVLGVYPFLGTPPQWQ